MWCIVQPLLEEWHFEWTNLSQFFEAHWGPPLSKDPSRLGHSAEKIGRKQPSNQKKVDFYPNCDLAFLVLDARLLDCWRLLYQKGDLFKHFDNLASQKDLPSFETLEILARKLYRSYTSIRAQEMVIRGHKFMPDDSAVPTGTAWPLANAHGTFFDDPKSNSLPTPFKGDQVLARSIAFMREAMLAQELSLSTAEGDVGRVWEVTKILVFSFAGSSHGKYLAYILEMIVTLEVECSTERRKGLLQMTLVNLTGRPGHWSAGDFVQEYFNRLLEAIVERKGVEYGDKFIHKTWSQNIHHIARLKLLWFDGLGIKTRSSKHAGAKHNTELRLLLAVYQDSGLHTFCAARSYDDNLFVDDYQHGMEELGSKKLRKWIHKTT
ncbi:hypothetical protein CPB83DRAFT_840712 [Crepidotus variabilis]|uniref:DUF6589 domain-containing protein n=1 Tax=Crepidotus variabilis TaxID=179855 RepID=A0A9P6E482_9AGAR|nr:hypothetical protein CPB83DRAFT_840712 [Crepidotus variabilis]